MIGGRANISFQFEGFNAEAAQGTNTEWAIDKVGDTATITYTGTGDAPNIAAVSIGDVIILTRDGLSRIRTCLLHPRHSLSQLQTMLSSLPQLELMYTKETEEL
jgi:hypothetical protein